MDFLDCSKDILLCFLWVCYFGHSKHWSLPYKGGECGNSSNELHKNEKEEFRKILINCCC